VPGSGLVAIRGDLPGAAVRWLNAETLATVAGPPGMGAARRIWASPGGEYVAVVGADGMEVHDLRLSDVAGLLARPLADARPEDLAIVRAAAGCDAGPGAKQAIGLLRACLEYRFGTELALGDAGAVTARADDIELGRGEPC
jgi:hypothetical protein